MRTVLSWWISTPRTSGSCSKNCAAEWNSRECPAQKLLLPQTFELPPRDAEWIERNLSVLQKMGIGIERFGPDTFKIDSLPSFLDVPDAGAIHAQGD